MYEGYVGQETQISGVEEHRLVGGRGDGMRLLEVRNGLGLAFTVSVDRCADLSRLSFRGHNFGFFSASGYVHPAYYDGQGKGSERSFTGGFLATCGLANVGAPCADAGEDLPLHGGIGNLPAEHVSWDTEGEHIQIKATVPHGGFFDHKLVLNRTLLCSKTKNELTLTDRVTNVGDRESPVMLLYHINLGYPLLSEGARLHLPSARVFPRDAQAEEGLSVWDRIGPPQAQFAEQCYFHEFDGPGAAGLFNPGLDTGVLIQFDKPLNSLTQWKQLGFGEYVMGLEPGNCRPDGRAEARRRGALKVLAPGREETYSLRLTFLAGAEDWARATGG